MTNNSLTEIAAVLNRSSNVAVVCHFRPDGDALGSALALGCALKNAGKNVYVLCEDPTPDRLCVFPIMKTTLQALPVKLEELDLFVSVDSAELNRIGGFAAQYAALRGKRST